MNVVIVGGGKVGAYLARDVVGDGHDCTLVEMDPMRCEQLQEMLRGVRVVCGDGDEPSVLDAADVRVADALVAATGEDEDNLVVCLLGKMEYDVPFTVARIINPENTWLYSERFGVDVPVSNTAIMTEVLKKVSLGDIVTVLRLQAENTVLDELSLTPESRAVGKRLAELALPECGHVVAVVSEGSVVLPGANPVLKAGDEVLILSQCADEAALRHAFGIDG